MQVGLQDLTHAFKIHLGISTVSAVGQAEEELEKRHEDLLKLLAAHPEISSSESSSVGTLSIFNARRVADGPSSVESFAMLPASPKIFHGRGSELQQMMDLLSREAPRIVILGPGGMGKTSLALAVLHSDTASKYVHRHFVACHSSPGYSELISSIAFHVGVDQGPGLARKIVQHFSRSEASFLVLDNFETPWEAVDGRAEVEELLSLLADVPNLAILVTIRGAERPGKVKWTRPCPLPLAPLSSAAALQTFRDISDSPDNDTTVRKLLDLTGGLPLAVSLIASVAAHEGCDAALERWETESIRLLSDGFDKTSSLEISITLSLSGPRMDLEAQKLLSILSMLPDGLSDTDLVQSTLPISGILRCKTTLLSTSLAHTDHGHRLKVLAPIREYVYSIYPPSSEIKLAIRQYFHEILELWDESRKIPSLAFNSQISANLGNLYRLFSDAMQMDYSDMLANLRSTLHFNNFCRHMSSRVGIPLSSKIVDYQEDPIFATYLIAHLRTLQSGGGDAAEAHIQLGHRYFESSGALERARWHNTLGHHYLLQTDYVRARQYRESALSLASISDGPTQPQWQALLGISLILAQQGDSQSGKAYAKQSHQCAISLGDIYGASRAIAQEAAHCLSLGDFREAAALCAEARELFRACGLEGGMADIKVQIYQAEIHVLRTQYLDARAINESILASDSRSLFRDAFTHLNLALIDIAIDGAPETIHLNVNIAREYFSSLNLTIGSYICDIASGDLHLRDGNPADARRLFTAALPVLTRKLDEGAMSCLERLADLWNGMHNIDDTFHWAGIFLASAQKAKNRLAIMKAIRCLGDVLAALNDEETALQLFEVALKGFSSVGVHAWAASSMVRISGILEKRGSKSGLVSLERAVELLREARPLFERSSQVKQIGLVDSKLAALIQ
ncbi:hypothetical protein B0H16DRAFT_1723523 [Mycena metata]|uniref:Novel STAND NTPase 1 domain-containing protein n=1 Tax=Mycena metata TaxID=1033252 RepID=A0AAD7J1N7_9AGAR|nr:hypothetical protein B0H16DRAFT_1723523 [Mycena metata]